MTILQKQIDKEKLLKRFKKNIWITLNNILLVLILSCSQNQMSEITEWKRPQNEFPEIFQLHHYTDYSAYSVEIRPESLEFGCIERNDYPHYWCDFEAELVRPFKKYPKKVIAMFMSSRPIEFVNKYKKIVKNINNKKIKTRIYFRRPFISEEDDEDKGQMLGVFDGIDTVELCTRWFNHLESCPKNLEKTVI